MLSHFTVKRCVVSNGSAVHLGAGREGTQAVLTPHLAAKTGEVEHAKGLSYSLPRKCNTIKKSSSSNTFTHVAKVK